MMNKETEAIEQLRRISRNLLKTCFQFQLSNNCNKKKET